MSTFVMSDKYPEFVSEINKMGHTVIPSDTIEAFLLPEQKHADMQILTINNDVFILDECVNLKSRFAELKPIICTDKAGEKYPENILLNFLFFKNCLFGKKKYIDNSLREYCVRNRIEIINVNQGYCRCSTLVISENAAITADEGIEAALKSKGAEVLKISSGHITLDGFDYGFIGGAGGRIDENTVVFFGNVKKHPDYESIKLFCERHNAEIKIICKNSSLTDIGGIVKLK